MYLFTDSDSICMLIYRLIIPIDTVHCGYVTLTQSKYWTLENVYINSNFFN